MKKIFLVMFLILLAVPLSRSQGGFTTVTGTITGGGAAPTTLAAASTAILQSQLVSSSAAGCNWVRLQ
jgi:hypothetical protein